MYLITPLNSNKQLPKAVNSETYRRIHLFRAKSQLKDILSNLLISVVAFPVALVDRIGSLSLPIPKSWRVPGNSVRVSASIFCKINLTDIVFDEGQVGFAFLLLSLCFFFLLASLPVHAGFLGHFGSLTDLEVFPSDLGQLAGIVAEGFIESSRAFLHCVLVRASLLRVVSSAKPALLGSDRLLLGLQEGEVTVTRFRLAAYLYSRSKSQLILIDFLQSVLVDTSQVILLCLLSDRKLFPESVVMVLAQLFRDAGLGWRGWRVGGVVWQALRTAFVVEMLTPGGQRAARRLQARLWDFSEGPHAQISIILDNPLRSYNKD